MCQQSLLGKLEEKENDLNSEKKNALKRDKTIQGLTQVFKEKEKQVKGSTIINTVYIIMCIIIISNKTSTVCALTLLYYAMLSRQSFSWFRRLQSCVMRLRTGMTLWLRLERQLIRPNCRNTRQVLTCYKERERERW